MSQAQWPEFPLKGGSAKTLWANGVLRLLADRGYFNKWREQGISVQQALAARKKTAGTPDALTVDSNTRTKGYASKKGQWTQTPSSLIIRTRHQHLCLAC